MESIMKGELHMSKRKNRDQSEMIKEPEKVQEIKKGIVTDCLTLNIRKDPDINSEVVGNIKCLSEIMIEDKESTDEFYKICTASGKEGFCMKKYIVVSQ